MHIGSATLATSATSEIALHPELHPHSGEGKLPDEGLTLSLRALHLSQALEGFPQNTMIGTQAHRRREIPRIVVGMVDLRVRLSTHRPKFCLSNSIRTSDTSTSQIHNFVSNIFWYYVAIMYTWHNEILKEGSKVRSSSYRVD